MPAPQHFHSATVGPAQQPDLGEMAPARPVAGHMQHHLDRGRELTEQLRQAGVPV